MRYVYAEPNAPSQLQPEPSTMSLRSADLAIMPSEWIAQLRQAASNLDDEQILQLLDQIPAEQGAIAAVLTDLVRNFRLDTILELTQTPAP